MRLMGRIRPPASVRGFAMLDVLIAAMMLGIIVVGTMEFFTFGQGQISALARERTAYDLACNRLEELVPDGYANAVDRTDTGLTVDGQSVTRTTTITYVDDPADSTGNADLDGTQDYKLVRVDVTYGTKMVTLRTLLAP